MVFIKFEAVASAVPEILRESQNFKGRSRDSDYVTFDIILHFCIILIVRQLDAKFEVCIII